MRTETTTRELYTFDELDEDAQEKARDNYRERKAQWWDGHDVENIGATILYMLADKLKSPGWDTYGEGDFPGIDGVEIVEWDIERQNIAIKGTLTRENAPALPWVDGMTAYTMNPRSAYSNETDGADWDFDPDEELTEDEYTNRRLDERANEADMEQAIREAMYAALYAGRDEQEYRFSDEAIDEEIEANEREFLADGTLA